MMKAITSVITKILKNSVAFNNGFFTAVPAFRQGHLHISPVDLDSILFNAALYAAVEQEGHEDTVTLHGKKALLTHSATQALDLALEQLQLATPPRGLDCDNYRQHLYFLLCNYHHPKALRME
jgi:hypothetical protein